MVKTYLGNEVILVKKYKNDDGTIEIVCNMTEEQKNIMKEKVK